MVIEVGLERRESKRVERERERVCETREMRVGLKEKGLNTPSATPPIIAKRLYQDTPYQLTILVN